MTDFSTITACGECCVGCEKKIKGICPGCIEAEGRVPEWAGSGICKVYACCREHNAKFCGLCEEFPCNKLPQMISWNPNIVEHLTKLRDEYKKRNVKLRKAKKEDMHTLWHPCWFRSNYANFFDISSWVSVIILVKNGVIGQGKRSAA